MLPVVLVSFVVSSVSVSGNNQLWAEQANTHNKGLCPDFLCFVRCQRFPAATCVVEKIGQQCRAKYYYRHTDVTVQCNQNIQEIPMMMPSFSSRSLPEDKSMFSEKVINWLSLMSRFMKRDFGDLENPENIEQPTSTLRDIIENFFAEMVPTQNFDERRFRQPNRNVPWNFAKPENRPFQPNHIPKAMSTFQKTSSDWLSLLSKMIERDSANNEQNEIPDEPISVPGNILETIFTKLIIKEPSQTPTPALPIPMAPFSWTNLPSTISSILKTSMNLLPLLSMNSEENDDIQTEDSEEPIPFFSDILNTIYGQLKYSESPFMPIVMKLIPKAISTIVGTSNDWLSLFSRNAENEPAEDGPVEYPLDTIVDVFKNIYQQIKESTRMPIEGASIPMAPVSWRQLPNTVSIIKKVMQLVPLLMDIQRESTEEEDIEKPISLLSGIEKELHDFGYKTKNDDVNLNSPTYNFYRAISLPTQSLKPQNIFRESHYRFNLPSRTRYATASMQNIPEANIFRASQYTSQPFSLLGQVIQPYSTVVDSSQQFSPTEPSLSSSNTQFIQQPFFVTRSTPQQFPTTRFLQRQPFIVRHTDQNLPDSTQIRRQQFFPTATSENLRERGFAQQFLVSYHDSIPQTLPSITQNIHQRFPWKRICMKPHNALEQQPRSLIIRRTQWYPTPSYDIQQTHSATRDSLLHFPSNANVGQTWLQRSNQIQQLPTAFVHGRQTNTLEIPHFPIAQNPNIFGHSFPKLSRDLRTIPTLPKPTNLPSGTIQQISNPLQHMPWFNSNANLFQNKQMPAKNMINRSFIPQTFFPVVSPSGVKQTLSANVNHLPLRTAISSQRGFNKNDQLLKGNQQHFFPMPAMGLKTSSPIQHIPLGLSKGTYASAPRRDLSVFRGTPVSIPIQTVKQKSQSMTQPGDSQTKIPSNNMAKELIIIKSLKPRIPSKLKQTSKVNDAVGKYRPTQQTQVSTGELQNLPSEKINSKLNTNVNNVIPEVHQTPIATNLNSSSDLPKETNALPLTETTKQKNLPLGPKLYSEKSSPKMTPNIFKMPVPKAFLPNIPIIPFGNSEFTLKMHLPKPLQQDSKSSETVPKKASDTTQTTEALQQNDASVQNTPKLSSSNSKFTLIKHLPKPLPQDSKPSEIVSKQKSEATQTSVKLQKNDASVQNIPKLSSSKSEFTLKKHLPKPLPQDSKPSETVPKPKTGATQTPVRLQKNEASVQNTPKLLSSNSDFTLKKHLPKPLPQDSKPSETVLEMKNNAAEGRVELQKNEAVASKPKSPSSDTKVTLKSQEQKKHLPKPALQDRNSGKTLPKKLGHTKKTPVKARRMKTFGF